VHIVVAGQARVSLHRRRGRPVWMGAAALPPHAIQPGILVAALPARPARALLANLLLLP
jgi:hypothetical protein